MIYDRDEERCRSALRKAARAAVCLPVRATEPGTRTGSPIRTAGPTTATMAEARYYLRALPADRYVQAILPYADQVPDGDLVDIEVLAVGAHIDDWTQKGQALLHERARLRYEEECRAFETWAADNPGKESWRDRPATRAQWMLIRRTVEALDLPAMPSRISCGDAYDWLQEHGANVRFRAVDDKGNGADVSL